MVLEIYWNVKTDYSQEKLNQSCRIMLNYFPDMTIIDPHMTWARCSTLYARTDNQQQISAFLLAVKDHNEIVILNCAVLT